MGKRKNKRKTITPRRRMYGGAKAGRLMFSASESSADAELYTSLKQLRARSRALVRDVVYAKRAKQVVINNVIGQGVGLQGKVKRLRGERLLVQVNAGIERAWLEWSRPENCHTGGALHFSDLERLALGEVFEAGEVFLRLHPSAFGDSAVPLVIELIEAERIADDQQISSPTGAKISMGIEHDEYGRPSAYYVHKNHPNDLRPGMRSARDEIMRIPAEQVVHLRLIDRWPQTRGVPGLHAAINRLNQLGEYENAALVAARIGASKVGFFESTEFADDTIADDQEADGTPSTRVEPGEFTQLPYGYKFTGWDPNYPTDAFDPFTRACLRGIAAGVGVSYESLSRDYSQSNYSSSRLALLDDRDLWRVLQAWWCRTFREPLHRVWLRQAVLAGAIQEIDRSAYLADVARFAAVAFKPRGWGWVDPTKEVAAYKEAERAGYTTKADIIAATGGGADLEDVIDGRRRELDLLAEAGIATDTTEQVASVPPDESVTDSDEAAPLRVVGGDE
jgi:lambda family phage portal protein